MRKERVHQISEEGNIVRTKCGLEIYLHTLFVVKDLDGDLSEVDFPFEVIPCKACLEKE